MKRGKAEMGIRKEKLCKSAEFALLFALSFVITAILPPSASAREFVIQNESANMPIINGTAGSISMAPGFGKGEA